MIAAYLADVGDGMAAGIRTISGETIQIDCGSQQNTSMEPARVLRALHPHTFILSHFHLDHYNGLLGANRLSRWPRTAVHEVLFPRIPEFPEKERFLLSLFAINNRMLGNASGSMEADLLSIFSHTNLNSFTYRSLASGDQFDVEGSRFSVLWPPRVVDNQATLKLITTALSHFEEAIKQDDVLRRIYDDLGDRGIVHKYLGVEPQSNGIEVSDNRGGRMWNNPELRELPGVTARANRSLRDAANHFSLAIQEDNRFLFLGDLETYELKRVVESLKEAGSTRFFVLVTPHHGTHWHKSLKELRCSFALSSVGPRLFKKLRPEFKGIADECWVTHLTGDVQVPYLGQSYRYRQFPRMNPFF